MNFSRDFHTFKWPLAVCKAVNEHVHTCVITTVNKVLDYNPPTAKLDVEWVSDSDEETDSPAAAAAVAASFLSPRPTRSTAVCLWSSPPSDGSKDRPYRLFSPYYQRRAAQVFPSSEV